ncbi:MAG TPA: EscU/YscU/HrcU family type III secretion system export apparatus switch protein, partial [Acidiferrobacterales bacterium]|nr:EscU/YscU/HrcU family type III secretion system export apparatus switch protein [Acidiferrobacterales bacterium]
MADSAQDRNLPASQRKIKKAREDGQVARSRDLGHFAALAAAGALLATMAPGAAGWLKNILAAGLQFDARLLAQPDAMGTRLGELALKMMWIVLPLGAAMLAVALAAGVTSGGWNWTLKPMLPNFGKLNPVAGLGRMFSKHQLGETLKACVLALVLGGIGVIYLRAQLPAFVATLDLPLPAALTQATTTLQDGLILLVAALAVFALIDVPLQRKWLQDRLKMSHQEAKEEFKQLEGNVEVKGKMRALMRERVKRRMLAAVPKADLVVMNPTHYAVALKYDDATMAAPRVVAKGADLLALRIRDIAKDSGVPVLEAPP